MRATRLLLSALLIAPAALQAAEAPPAAQSTRPVDLVAIDVGPGFNTIPGFTPDGRPARILKAWRENGNANGYYTYVITTSAGMGRGDWNIVPITIPTPFSTQDVLRDEPHAFEDTVRSIRFARGKIGGEETEAVLLIATREVKDAVPNPVPVRFDLYRVVITDEMGDVLERVRSWRSVKSYCHADAALLHEVALALPPDYEGGEREDGCT